MRCLLFLVVAACGGASYQNVHIVNQSPRPIEAVYIYPTGSQNRGASRGTVAPNASIDVKVKSGNVDVLAIGAKEKVNDKESERKEATQTLELRAPTELVFHDSNQPVATKPGTIDVEFRVIEEKKPPEDAPPTEP